MEPSRTKRIQPQRSQAGFIESICSDELPGWISYLVGSFVDQRRFGNYARRRIWVTVQFPNRGATNEAHGNHFFSGKAKATYASPYSFCWPSLLPVDATTTNWR